MLELYLQFLLEKILLLKILRSFSFILRNNITLLRKDLFPTNILPFLCQLIYWLIHFVLYQYFLMTNFPCVHLLKTIGNEYYFFSSMIIFPLFFAYSSLSNFILFCNFLISFNLSIIKSFNWIFGNKLPTCFNWSILLETFKDFRRINLIFCLFLKSFS